MVVFGGLLVIGINDFDVLNVWLNIYFDDMFDFGFFVNFMFYIKFVEV